MVAMLPDYYSSTEDETVRSATLTAPAFAADETPVQAEADFLPDAYYRGLFARYTARVQAGEVARREADARRLAEEKARARMMAEAKAAQTQAAPPRQSAPPEPARRAPIERPAQRPASRYDTTRAMNSISLGPAVMPDPSDMAAIAPQGFPPNEYVLIEDTRSLERVVHELGNEPVLAVDTETTGLDPYSVRLLLVQVATPTKCYVVDAVRVDITPLKRLFSNERILKLLHNAKFDYKILKQAAQGPSQQPAGVSLENVYDSYLAERLLTAGLGMECSLAAVVKRYLGETMDKSVRKTFYAPAGHSDMALPTGSAYKQPDQLAYAARDVLCLFPIYLAQRDKLRKEKLEVAANIEFQCAPAVGDLELAGCRINTEKWRGILVEVARKRDQALEELMGMLPSGGNVQNSLFGGAGSYTLNMNSGPQIIAEFKRLGIEIADTSEPTLQKVNHPAAKKLLEYRGHEKTLGAFGESLLALINPRTGRVHADFMQYGADTGRFSAQNPNVQQIPTDSDFRSCFVAAEGYKLVTSDYSQAELRILAELSQDEGFVTAFNTEGVDLHKLTASKMFHVAYEDVTKAQRSASKAINFGLAYGMGSQGLAGRIEVPEEEAKNLIDQYFQAYTGVQAWLNKAAKDAVRYKYSVTPVGRKRYYNVPDRDDPEYRKKISAVERQGKNSPIQGANCDMTKMALIFLRSALQGYDARVVNTVHDEIVVEVREDQAETVCEIVEREMRRAGEEIITSVPIKSDAKVGDYWSK